MTTSIYKILVLYFCIGFFSDFGLNYLSRQSYAPAAVKVLKFYFDRKTIKSDLLRHCVSAINAGLTIVSAIIVTILISNVLFGFLHPKQWNELWRFLIIAFGVGYLDDILIYKTQLFGDTLNPYYKLAGVGLWGALAFIFSILVCYCILLLK